MTPKGVKKPSWCYNGTPGVGGGGWGEGGANDGFVYFMLHLNSIMDGKKRSAIEYIYYMKPQKLRHDESQDE